ncbi:hypothetical protein L227DRAFT_568476 [Lentinus tigrinus ALCF2SS1-6]|uniref:Uncharacterized protein n=1 Tax=Lentinus tigrinus ALCF2SS1-6 TaxID=1328759 RepID=A0A5C2RQ27_9APHY|nr:hypothetical protein L227DRAFT_568476 [Lentinus tigrinus ALCF2SS1-6]
MSMPLLAIIGVSLAMRVGACTLSLLEDSAVIHLLLKSDPWRGENTETSPDSRIRRGADVTAADEDESFNIDDRHEEKRYTLAPEDEVESIGTVVEDPSVVEGASVLLDASVDGSEHMERGLRIEDSHEENRTMLEKVVEDGESGVEIGVGRISTYVLIDTDEGPATAAKSLVLSPSTTYARPD